MSASHVRGAIVEHCHRDAGEERYSAWEVIITETPTLGQHLAILVAYIQGRSCVMYGGGLQIHPPKIAKRVSLIKISLYMHTP